MNVKRSGISDVYINLHYLSDQICSYFGDGSKLGLNIHYSYEEFPLGTAGALLNIKEHLEKYDKIFCIYGDIISNQDLQKVLEYHNKSNALLTFVSHKRQKSNSVAVTDPNGKITTFLERPSQKELNGLEISPPFNVNSAIYCLEKEVLDLIPKDKKVTDFPKDIFPEILKRDRLFTYPLDGFRVAVDGSARLEGAKQKMKDCHSIDDFWKLSP